MTSSSAAEQATVTEEAPLSPLVAAGVLLGVIVLVGGYLFLAGSLGVAEFWAGFLFLLYWAGIEHMDMENLPASIGGGFFGIFLAFLSHEMAALAGLDQNTGLIIFLGVLLVVIFFQIMGKFAILINMMTMLYLTVGTIPAVQENTSAVGMASALALAIVYFCGLVWGGKRLAGK